MNWRAGCSNTARFYEVPIASSQSDKTQLRVLGNDDMVGLRNVFALNDLWHNLFQKV
jgi:hypothetical protein